MNDSQIELQVGMEFKEILYFFKKALFFVTTLLSLPLQEVTLRKWQIVLVEPLALQSPEQTQTNEQIRKLLLARLNCVACSVLLPRCGIV